ncbi:hypothetical protein ACOXXX_10255 [Thalassococcus sp. BH17M4-6]|uniref:hypothetical protein n=1 Tax=Thalassococcus sp. BH17M4-6 TaxID=3413148 RepID=UPI003BC96010
MAIVGLVIGSVLGLFASVTGWLMWDLSALSAFGLYLSISLAMATLMAVLSLTRPSSDEIDGSVVRA